VGFLLDTNIVSDLVRHPAGRIAERIAQVGEEQICTSIIVAAELRYGATKRASARLAAQLEAVLAAIPVLSLEAPSDVVYRTLRTQLESRGRPIGANDLLIAAQTLALGHTLVTDNASEFAYVPELSLEDWLRDG
jgi:tRNA(fMet)-specific endonuclease VapC